MKYSKSYNDNELIWIDHQNGKLGYYLNDDREAVLCDYTGDDSILILPFEVGEGRNCVSVSPYIPDEAFQSCEAIKLVIVDSRSNRWDFGMFLFQNCAGLKGLVDLYAFSFGESGLKEDRAGISNVDELSFIDSNYAPKKIEMLEMSVDWDDFYNERVYMFLNLLNEQHLENHLIELLKTIRHYSSLTGEVLDAYDDAEVIKHATQFGCNIAELNFLGQLWKECKESSI